MRKLHTGQILDQVALLLSIVFSPIVVVVVFPLLIMLDSLIDKRGVSIWAILWMIFCAIIPTIYVYWLIKIGRVSNFHLDKRTERSGPYLVGIMSSLVLAVIFIVLHAPIFLIALITCLIVNNLMLLIINKWWKISAHLTAASTAIITMSVIVSVYFVWLYIFIPLLIWARVRRKRHTWKQAVGAFLLSTIINIVILYSFRLIH